MSKNRYHILWILLLAGVLRLIQIDAPPVGRHAWRQCDTASVARNFHQNGYRLLYPQIDWEIPGYVEMEFPVYPWTASLLYGLLGESDALARLLAVAGSLVTIGFLFAVVRRILGERAALWSALLLAVLPLSLFFGRAIMPESWMLAATAAAVYFFLRWTEEDSGLFYSLALLATTLACLLKLTSLYLGLPLLWLAWQRWGRQTFVRWRFWLFGIAVTSVLLVWYAHAYRLGQQFGASFHIFTAAGSDKWGNWALLLEPDFYHQVFVGNLGGRMLTWAGYPIFLVGLFLRRRAPREALFDVWLLAVTIMLLLANGGSYQHDYYSLPLLLPAVVFMSKVFDRGWESRKPLLATLAVLILILSGYRHLGTLAEERRPGIDTTIAEALARETAQDELVISCNSANPTWLYLSGRRGWGRDCGMLGKIELEHLIDRGARYLVDRGPSGSAPPSRPRVGSYARVFHRILRDDETLFLASLTPPPRFEDLSWRRVLERNFNDAAGLDSWDLEGGRWHIAEGSLVGTRVRQRAEAWSRPALPACDVCTIRMSLTLARPARGDNSSDPARRHRGSGRAHSQASIDLWWQEPATGVTLTLGTKKGRVTLAQWKNGAQIDTQMVDFPLLEGRPVDLELRSDPLELELRVEGQSLLKTPHRLDLPLSGRLGLRPRLGSIRVDQLSMEVPTGSSGEARLGHQP